MKLAAFIAGALLSLNVGAAGDLSPLAIPSTQAGVIKLCGQLSYISRDATVELGNQQLTNEVAQKLYQDMRAKYSNVDPRWVLSVLEWTVRPPILSPDETQKEFVKMCYKGLWSDLHTGIEL